MRKLWVIPLGLFLVLAPTAKAQGKLKATLTGHSVTLSWTVSPTTGAGYNVYRSATVAGPFTVIASPTTTSYVDTTVTTGTTYFYEVSATCGPTACGPNIIPSSESALSAPVTAVIPNTQPPGTPTGLAATVAVLHVGTQDKITATWSDVPMLSTFYVLFNSTMNFVQMNGAPTPNATGTYSISYTGAPFNGNWAICDAHYTCTILNFIG